VPTAAGDSSAVPQSDIGPANPGTADTSASDGLSNTSEDVPASTAPVAEGQEAAAPQAPVGKDRAGLRDFGFPYEVEVPGKAFMSPTCVMRGDIVTLNVETKPGAALGYQALYQGNETGTDAPFGDGHGGNDKGQADPSGAWSDSWTLGPKAPFGKARVDVVIGWEGKWGYEKAYFVVAKSAQDCS
jgi:hypothetical protein